MNKLSTLPLLIDGLAVTFLFLFLPNLAQQFQTPSGINALIIFLGYSVFCSGVFLLRKLEGSTNRSDKPANFARQTFIVFAILFGIGMMLFISQQLGYLDQIFTDPYSLGEGQAAAFFVFAPSAWLGVSLFYIPVLAFKVTPTVAPDTNRHTLQSLYSLLAINGMLLLATAQLKALISNGRLGWFILSFVLLAVWFAPPRWLYWEKRASSLSLFSFTILLLLCSWQIIA